MIGMVSIHGEDLDLFCVSFERSHEAVLQHAVLDERELVHDLDERSHPSLPALAQEVIVQFKITTTLLKDYKLFYISVSSKPYVEMRGIAMWFRAMSVVKECSDWL